MKILIKLTSRSRPEKFFKTVQSVCDNSVTDDWVIMATLDKNDESMMKLDVLDRLDQNSSIIYHFGESKNKIDAINRDMDKAPADWDILISISDDQIVAPGFDEQIISDMTKHFPDLDGMLFYNDGNQKDNVSTMQIVGRKYYERTNYIYNPSYISLWVDVEATEVAHILGKLKYGGDNVDVYKHLHPAFSQCEWDEQYRKTEDPEIWKADKLVIDARREVFYNIPESERVNGLKYPVL